MSDALEKATGRRTLVLLTGPVGAGKSSTAEALGETLRRAGRRPAVIDLDEVYGMARQSEGFGNASTWRTARSAGGALAARFFEDGLDVVIIEGGFYDQSECDDVRRALPPDAESVLVTLNVSHDETARRVEADPATDRVLSRDPNVLKFLYRHYASALPFLRGSSVVVDGDSMTVDETAHAMAEAILRSAP